MPFYEYQCEKCNEIYEIFIRNGDKIPENCEVCGGRLHKIISASTFHLKGSGWYITDYSRSNSIKGDHTQSSAKNRVSSKKDNSTPDNKVKENNSSIPTETSSKEKATSEGRTS